MLAKNSRGPASRQARRSASRFPMHPTPVVEAGACGHIFLTDDFDDEARTPHQLRHGPIEKHDADCSDAITANRFDSRRMRTTRAMPTAGRNDRAAAPNGRAERCQWRPRKHCRPHLAAGNLLLDGGRLSGLRSRSVLRSHSRRATRRARRDRSDAPGRSSRHRRRLR